MCVHLSLLVLSVALFLLGFLVWLKSGLCWPPVQLMDMLAFHVNNPIHILFNPELLEDSPEMLMFLCTVLCNTLQSSSGQVMESV